jgi:hypothetical protein
MQNTFYTLTFWLQNRDRSEISFEIPASGRSIDDSTNKSRFFEAIGKGAKGENFSLPPSILLWSTSITDSNYQDFQIFSFTDGVVARGGEFEGIAEPHSLVEYVSLLYFVIFKHFAKDDTIGSKQSYSHGSLRERVNAALDHLQTAEGVPLKRIINEVFLDSPGPEGLIWSGGYFHAVTGISATNTSPTVSPVRLFLQLSRLIRINHRNIARNKELRDMQLSVSRLTPSADPETKPTSSKRSKSLLTSVEDDIDWEQ